MKSDSLIIDLVHICIYIFFLICRDINVHWIVNWIDEQKKESNFDRDSLTRTRCHPPNGEALMKSAPDSRDFRSGWYARRSRREEIGVGEKGAPRGANTKATKRDARPGNATLASSRYVCRWRFHISPGHHLSRTPHGAPVHPFAHEYRRTCLECLLASC